MSSTLDRAKIHQVFITDADGDPAGITVDTTGLATDTGQAEIVAAIESISIPAPVGVALETTQEDVLSQLEAQTLILDAQADVLPPRMLNGATGAVTTIAVNKSDTGATTLQAADTDEAWQLASAVLAIAGATTLTFDSGGVDLVLPIAAAGILILDHKESGWNTGAINTLFSLASTNAVQITGVIQLQKV